MSYKITPEIMMSPSKKGYEVWYVTPKGLRVLYKKYLSLDAAQKESVSLCGHARLIEDICKMA